MMNLFQGGQFCKQRWNFDCLQFWKLPNCWKLPETDIFFNFKKTKAQYHKLSFSKNDEQLSNVMTINQKQYLFEPTFQNSNQKKLIKKAKCNNDVFLVLAGNSKFETPE